ncbi:hypothetical protein F7734_10545 [Scytonema sp. UIC 10036]|uniref:hypothetical protein n=1 Tax=Scytonema sp. UIC 10036 TaxID=2304196 RepID=UPI0012DA8F54|nr:hypothetical protein [Scytonema sp. UIC 10036]MUG92863.1 hypothetical protein [Scytonema sp. UIC 10036]
MFTEAVTWRQISMNIVDKAWEMLKNVSPDLIIESFLEKLKPIFEENKDLSDDELMTKMLEAIKNEKLFGEILAQAAAYALNNPVSMEEASKEVESSYNNLETEEEEQPERNQEEILMQNT